MVEDSSGSDDQNKTKHSEKDSQNGIAVEDPLVEDHAFNEVDNDPKKGEKIENKENVTDDIEKSNTFKSIDNNVNNTETGYGFMSSSPEESKNNSVQTTENPNEIDEHHETTADIVYDTKGEVIEYLDDIDFGHLDIKVGSASFVLRHPNPSKSVPFKEQIRVGTKEDGAPETYYVESGIPKQYSMTRLQYCKLVVLCNINPVTRRGLENKIAVLCARKGDKTDLLTAPYESDVGDPIVVEGSTPKLQKPFVSNVFKTFGTDLRVNNKRQVEYKGFPLRVKDCTGGFITTRRLSNCSVGTVMQDIDI